MRKIEFANKVGISASTLAKLSKNETISMEVVVKICRGLEYNVEDIMDVLPETKV